MFGAGSVRSRRLGYIAAAIGAAAVATIFATIGDGVRVDNAVGLRRSIVDGGHTVVWVLLAAGFSIAAVRGRWSAPSQILAVAAGGTYLLFLIAVFVGP